MRTGLLFAFCFFSISLLSAQQQKLARVNASLKIAPGTKTGGTAVLVIEVTPDPQWHVYSLEETGAYKKTEIVLNENTKQAEAKGAATEEGKKITEFDELMGGNLNFFEGPVVFSQEIKIKGKQPMVAGMIEYQICNGDKCVVSREEFKLEGKL